MLDRLKAGGSSVKTTYVEIVKTWLRQITGLSVKPVKCVEYYKCNPCEAAFYRYPLNLQANTGCMMAMFGGSLACEGERSAQSQSESKPRRVDSSAPDLSRSWLVVPHPYHPSNECFANSRVLITHHADRTLVNSSRKLLAHCIVDYCLPRHMYSPALSARCLDDCREHLLVTVASVRERLKRASAAFNTVMKNCPEHMIPACGTAELDLLRTNRES